MRIHRSTPALGLLALAVSACASLRPVRTLEPGQRIRVHVRPPRSSHYAGTLAALTADSLILSESDSTVPIGTDAPRVAFPIAAITKVELSGGVHGNAITGGAYGGEIGLIIGLTGSVARRWTPGDPQFMAVVGSCLVVGTAIGAGVRTERWLRYPLGSIRVGVAPLPDGRLGVGATLGLHW